MHWNALQKLIWSIFLWSFFDYCSSTAAFSKLFSVVEVCASLQKLTELRSKDDWGTSSGTILLYSRNLSNIVTISAKHQILRYIWRKNKLCNSQRGVKNLWQEFHTFAAASTATATAIAAAHWEDLNGFKWVQALATSRLLGHLNFICYKLLLLLPWLRMP